jgi:hypothetical protein
MALKPPCKSRIKEDVAYLTLLSRLSPGEMETSKNLSNGPSVVITDGEIMTK